MKLTEQLFRNYNELYEMIICCYKDVSILTGYETLQKDMRDAYNMAPTISNHFVLLLQKNLALTLWKIYFDKNQDANTVPKFRNAINELLRSTSCQGKQVKKEKINGNVESKLKQLRRQFLAHVDMTRSDSRILICELKDLLDAICREFNNICDVIDDDRVFNISEGKIGSQDMCCIIELVELYNRK